MICYANIIATIACIATSIGAIFTVLMYLKVRTITDSALLIKYKKRIEKRKYKSAFNLIVEYIDDKPSFILDAIYFNRLAFGFYVGSKSDYDKVFAELLKTTMGKSKFSDEIKDEFYNTVDKVFLSDGTSKSYYCNVDNDGNSIDIEK